MIRFVNEERLNCSITLLYANRNKESAAYLEELEAIAKQNPRLILKNKFGRIDAEFIQQSIQNTNEEALGYIVGPPLIMVAEMENILLRFGVSGDKIYLEEFIGYE